MQQENTNKIKPNIQNETRDQLFVYLRHWPWILLSLVLFYFLGKVYIRYSTPIFESSSTLLITDNRFSGSGHSELATFENAGVIRGGGFGGAIDNDIHILSSKNIIRAVVQKLELNVRFYLEGNIKTSEVYNDKPFLLNIHTDSLNNRNFTGNYLVSIIDHNTVEFINQSTNQVSSVPVEKPFTLDGAQIFLTPNINLQDYLNSNRNRQYVLIISNMEEMVSSIQNRLQIQQPTFRSSILQLSLRDPIAARSEDILNELRRQYNLDANNDRLTVSRRTIAFLEDRIDVVFNELGEVESSKVLFRETNQISNLGAETQINISGADQNLNRRIEKQTQLALLDEMQRLLQSIELKSTLPANIGINNASLNSLINDYNKVVFDRNRLLENSTERNPRVVSLTNQLNELKQNLFSSLSNYRSSLQSTLTQIQEQESIYASRLRILPGKEESYRDFERQQDLVESLYLFLLQKREEIAISLATTSEKAKEVDHAFSVGQVAPNNHVIFLGSLLIGFLIPIGIIYLKELLNNKIVTRKDLEKAAPEIPILGELPKIRAKDNPIVQANDRSILAESTRILLTNLKYFLFDKEDSDKGQVIFTNSTIKGEGKTTASFNLALTMSFSGHNVVVVGGDIRNPQLQRYDRSISDMPGVTEYLTNKNLTIDDLLVSFSDHKDLKVIGSGVIPPNPSELWMTDRVATFFEELRNKFDYVIIDTAPSLLVSDTFSITKYADFVIYMVKSNYTTRELIEFPIDALKNNKIKKMAFVLNNVDLANFGYYSRGYGYGYRYAYSYGADADKNFLNRIKDWFKKKKN